ncbi:motile sperm domain-containing protein 1 isoform X2 [Eurytemora carolleeae]|uniref:motile sperm domain-containing protein 1 isoform X2 n=1 Tax=Eurytemora carolleeae TaxID=1294199 RepID=UPI000C782D1B|nr:motile sperm domain-containing protein 1 isoform X2 [Eurytemora carolleeae]|eukprot:XP_023325926.1 motile sperm domain-containing protein 1-like isoform X2 [Eurytemora affinis]
MSSSSTSIMDGRIPVFVFPVQLDFYYDDQTTHKRVVTIYNPYEFDVTFKVLCNNPKKYAVVEPEGRISGQKCVDIVIRHVAVSPQSVETTDKFRIHMFEEGTSEILGKKDVLAILHPGLPEAESASLGNKQRKSQPGFPLLKSDGDSPPRDVPVPNYIACFAAVVCILALFLPTSCENDRSQLLQDYPWLHLSLNQKLVFAYVLGLVTMAILRT